jgi:hypothetical protein
MLCMYVGEPMIPAQSPARSSEVISDGRPLVEVANRLQEMYVVPVTYEDPLWLWPGELEQMGHDTSGRYLAVKARSVFLQAVNPGEQPLGEVLEQVVERFNSETDGPQFRVVRSAVGWHIVPTKAYDADGKLSPAKNLLDGNINVVIAKRTAREHFVAICDSLARSSGIKVEFDQGLLEFDWIYGAAPPEFEWGASQMPAREALTQLLDRSATSLTWRLMFQASARVEGRSYLLALRGLPTPAPSDVVLSLGLDGYGRKATTLLTFDRCGNCVPPPRPPTIRIK